MVAETVEGSITTGTLKVMVCEWYAQPSLQHGDVQGWLVAESRSVGRGSVEEQSSIFGRDQLEVGLACGTT